MADLVLTEEQELLRTTAADWVRQHAPVARIRKLRDARDPAGFSLELWKSMAELGWPGIVLPEEYGGLGLGYAELAVVLEQLGAGLAPEPFLGTVLLAANAILLAGSEAQKKQILPRVAVGDAILAFAHHEPGARHRLSFVKTTAEPTGDGGYRLRGTKDLVFEGPVADRLVVSARVSGAFDARDGLGLFLVDPRSPGVERRPQQLLDSRVAATVVLDGARVEADAVLGAPGGAAETLDAVVDRALVGLSAEMLGGMGRAFEMTMAYLKERQQFGVTIGSFQALKHRAARMFVEVELSRSAVMAAARALDERSRDARALAALAKARLSDAFVQIANEAVQMHGGIGMTDEHDVGLYLKRARAAEITLGDAAYHRDRYARLQGY
jgi:alkylation response protein AidB-like acyl-CoA dehydrogenase